MKKLFTLLLLVCLHSTPAMAQEQYWEYTFRPGDSLWKIAEQYTNSANNWREIQRINRLRLGNNRKIQPGTRIVIPVSILKVQPTPARVIAVTGNAIVQRTNGQQTQPEVGTLLYSGDKIITAGGQAITLQFADHSQLQILADSIVVLDKLSYFKKTGMVDTRIRLDAGRVNTQVRKQQAGSRYQIRTPAATTAVRGTTFRLAFADKTSRTEVSEGKVGVSIGDSIKLVPAGFGLVAEQGKPLPEPVKLLPPPALNPVQLQAQSVTISWQALDGAVAYRYQLAADAQFNDMRLEQTISQTQLSLASLTPGQYFLRLRAIASNRLEGKNADAQFSILPTPVQTTPDARIIAPINTLMLNL